MKINIITLFPSYFEPLISTSIIGRAHTDNLVTTTIVNLRDFGLGSHKQVDDRPFGGGAGMLLMIEPIEKALSSINQQKGSKNKKIILTSAKGSLYSQVEARKLSRLEEVTIICGHYEGVDERVVEFLIDEEVRIGDYVLSGGEPAASVILDSVCRLLPGAVGNEASIIGESHDVKGYHAPPQFTRPADYNGLRVPEVLLSGNHAEISAWKTRNSNNNLQKS